MGLTKSNLYGDKKIRLLIANRSRQSLGGGWSFIDNLVKGLGDRVEFVDPGEAYKISEGLADVALVPSASMISREDFQLLKKGCKKVILRVDNALRNSRNRNSGMSRMKDFAFNSDVVLYQSRWSWDYLSPFLGFNGPIIHNGVDLDIFKDSGRIKDFGATPTYLYSRFSRDESKEWIRAWYKYQYIQREQKEAKLVIVGRFSDDLRAGDFDFFQGENWEYYGIAQTAEEMAQIYRGCHKLLATYHMDCFSNTYIEALCCGLQLYEPDMSGGTPEIVEAWKKNGRDYFGCQRMADEYYNLFKEVLK